MDLPPSTFDTLACAAHNNPAHAYELDPDYTRDLVQRGLLIQNPKNREDDETTFSVTREGQRVLNDAKQ